MRLVVGSTAAVDTHHDSLTTGYEARYALLTVHGVARYSYHTSRYVHSFTTWYLVR
jgi:hypothetical protein